MHTHTHTHTDRERENAHTHTRAHAPLLLLLLAHPLFDAVTAHLALLVLVAVAIVETIVQLLGAEGTIQLFAILCKCGVAGGWVGLRVGGGG